MFSIEIQKRDISYLKKKFDKTRSSGFREKRVKPKYWPLSLKTLYQITWLA